MTRSIKSRALRRERQQLAAELALHGWTFIGSYLIQNSDGRIGNLRKEGTHVGWDGMFWRAPLVPSIKNIALSALRAAAHHARTANENR